MLRASSGPHGVKIIINCVIESLVGADLLGQTRAGSRFVSVAAELRGELEPVRPGGEGSVKHAAPAFRGS